MRRGLKNWIIVAALLFLLRRIIQVGGDSWIYSLSVGSHCYYLISAPLLPAKNLGKYE
jgi:hypothetical protein